jgi:hypothetical protein
VGDLYLCCLIEGFLHILDIAREEALSAIVHPRIRRTEVRPICNRLAIAALLMVVRGDAGVEGGAEHFHRFPCMAKNPM